MLQPDKTFQLGASRNVYARSVDGLAASKITTRVDYSNLDVTWFLDIDLHF